MFPSLWRGKWRHHWQHGWKWNCPSHVSKVKDGWKQEWRGDGSNNKAEMASWKQSPLWKPFQNQFQSFLFNFYSFSFRMVSRSSSAFEEESEKKVPGLTIGVGKRLEENNIKIFTNKTPFSVERLTETSVTYRHFNGQVAPRKKIEETTSQILQPSSQSWRIGIGQWTYQRQRNDVPAFFTSENWKESLLQLRIVMSRKQPVFTENLGKLESVENIDGCWSRCKCEEIDRSRSRCQHASRVLWLTSSAPGRFREVPKGLKEEKVFSPMFET